MKAANSNIFNKISLPKGVSILMIALFIAFIVSYYLFPQLIEELSFNTSKVKYEFSIHSLLPSGALFTLISYQFLHSGIFHFLANSFMFFQVGPECEEGIIRAQKNNSKNIAALLFIVFFILCGILGGLGHIILNTDANLVGASGSISGVFGGYLISSYLKLDKATKELPELNISAARKKIIGLIFQSACVFLFINVFLAAISRQLNLIPISWEGHLFGFIGGLIFYPIILSIASKIKS